MKIPTAMDVVTIKRDQHTTRDCYVVASKESNQTASDTQLKVYFTKDRLSTYGILGVPNDTYPKTIGEIEVPLDPQILKVKMGIPI